MEQNIGLYGQIFLFARAELVLFCLLEQQLLPCKPPLLSAPNSVVYESEDLMCTAESHYQIVFEEKRFWGEKCNTKLQTTDFWDMTAAQQGTSCTSTEEPSTMFHSKPALGVHWM